MGKGKFDQKDEEIVPETPSAEYDLAYDYWVAQHLISNAQFLQFLDDSTYQYAYRKDLSRHINRPVVEVSGVDVMVFCQWLTQRWHQSGCLAKEWCVRLPDEVEWEKAARGGRKITQQPSLSTVTGIANDAEMTDKLIDNPEPQRRYPWGNEINSEMSNYAMKIGTTTTANIYPLNISPYGCEDMAGNVWEWTRSVRGEYPYPEINTEAWIQRTQVDTAENAVCVLRGGAFSYDPLGVRCAVRYSRRLGDRDHFIGFRVVLSPFL